MRVLGVDPGIRHTGWCVIEDKRVLARGVIEPIEEGRLLLCQVLRFVLPALAAVCDRWAPTVASVEEVAWYGKKRRITLPLSHVAGAIIGLLAARDIPVYSLLAMMKGKAKRRRTSWSEHEADAELLALVAQRAELAYTAVGVSIPRNLLAATKRRISIVRNAPTRTN